MKIDDLQSFILYRYRYTISYIAVAAVSLFAIFFRLQSLLPGISQGEALSGIANSNVESVIKSGVYLPYNLMQWFSLEVLGPTPLALRLPSVLFGLLSLMLLFSLLHLWHREKIAISIVLFMATSSWFLNFARYGQSSIYLCFAFVSLLFIASLMRHFEQNFATTALMALGIMLSLYAPFMIYFIVLFVVLYYKQIIGIIREMKNWKLISIGLLACLSLLPLVYGFVSQPETIKLWLGWDGSVANITDYFKNINSFASHIFWRSAEFPEQHLAKIAMLDLFTATMVALGLYHYEQHHNLLRTKMLIYGLGVMALIMGLTNNSANYIIVSPLLYIFAATGIVTLLKQWYNIFPINPLARALGLLPLLFAIIMTSQYHMQRYFYAWASSPSVRQVYPPEPILLTEDIKGLSADRSKIVIIVPQSLVAETAFLLHTQPRAIELATSIDKVTLPKPGTKVTMYIHGSLQKPPIKNDKLTQRVITTDRKSLPVGFNVIES